MANLQKHTKGALGNLGKHFERGLNSEGEMVKYGNQEIKPDLSHLNYNLGPDRGLSHFEFVNKRTSEVKCLKRKDINVLCTWVVTLPKKFPKEQEREFFEQTYKFLTDRYGGEENVASAYVHKDESQPHMHFAFVPVVKDRKKGHLKVSAKEAVNRKDLQSFHSDLSKKLERHFGRDIGILNEATKDGNRSIIDLKRGTAQEQVNTLEKQKKALEGQINALESKLKGKELTLSELIDIKPQKTITGAIKNIKFTDIENLQKTAFEYHKLKNDHEKLQNDYAKVQKLVPGIKERTEEAKERRRLKEIDKAFQKLPPEKQKELLGISSNKRTKSFER